MEKSIIYYCARELSLYDPRMNAGAGVAEFKIVGAVYDVRNGEARFL